MPLYDIFTDSFLLDIRFTEKIQEIVNIYE